MADPLKLLRQYIIENKEIIERDDQIIFGNVLWPKSFETKFVAWSGKEGSSETYYTLDCLLFFLKNKNVFHPEYCKLAKAANKETVSRPDRKRVTAYFSDERASSQSIEKRPLKNTSQVKTENKEDGESVAKKPRNEKTQVDQKQEQLPAHGSEGFMSKSARKRKRQRLRQLALDQQSRDSVTKAEAI